MSRTILLLFIVHNLCSVNCLHFQQLNNKDTSDTGFPLILTPYIENGKLEEARNLSRVKFPGFPELKSYSGIFTVNTTFDSSLFFWYFPSKKSIKEQVVILWLQGGPGDSSLLGLFAENGPIKVQNGTFKEREMHWALEHHILYIDNPVGAGFSFTNDSRGYCTDHTQVSDHLYNSLTQFFKLFPELQPFTFIITGESYAGKYIPALGYTIHKRNPSAKTKMNLRGLAIGNGFCDPINQLNYGEYIYQIGLIDWNQRNTMQMLQNETIELAEKKQWGSALQSLRKLVITMGKLVGNVSHFNFLIQWDINDFEEYVKLIEADDVRKALHVGNLSHVRHSTNVTKHLQEDFMKSVAPRVSELLNHYPVLFYNGQLDIIVAYTLTRNFLRKLEFSGSEEYKRAEREILDWMNPKTKQVEQVGFMKRAGNLTEVLIRNAGLMVSGDQPEWVLAVLTSWKLTFNSP